MLDYLRTLPPRFKDAETHADEDKKKKELIEIKNGAEAMVYSTEKTLTELSDKISEDAKKDITEKLDALKAVKDGDDFEAIKKATDEVMQAAQKVGEEMYKQQQAEGSADAQNPEAEHSEQNKESDEPEEGEIEEEK